jgi:hypothetical protein
MKENNNKKPFLMVVIAIFSLVTILHFLRLSLGWDLIINNWNLPTQISGLIIFISVFLIYWSSLLLSGSDKDSKEIEKDDFEISEEE